LLVCWMFHYLTNKFFFFTITMKSNNHGALHLPLDCNPTTKMWARLVAIIIMA
jgi:hypothetical protein